MKKIFVVAVVVFIFVLFQNCDRLIFDSPTRGGPPSQNPGNGHPYEGKLFVNGTGPLCTDNEKSNQILFKDPSSADLIRENCQVLDPARHLTGADFTYTQVNETILHLGKTYVPAGSLAPAVQRSACNISGFANSDLSNQNRIEFAYCLSLGRASDPQGLASYLADMAGGRTILSVTTSMLSSAEYINLYQISSLSLTDQIYLTYRVLLNRDPTFSELSGARDRMSKSTLTFAQLYDEIILTEAFVALYPLVN